MELAERLYGSGGKGVYESALALQMEFTSQIMALASEVGRYFPNYLKSQA